MPILARHEGVWEGTYTYFNAANEKVDEHASRLLCRFQGSQHSRPAPRSSTRLRIRRSGAIPL
jgi:hypothetical protein